MPIYPPHYEYARDFLRSFEKFKLDWQADMWFVFSNDADHLTFPEAKNAIVLPQNLELTREAGVINIKKFYGLLQIKEKYEYILVIDSETLIVKKTDINTVCDDFFCKKILWGNIPIDSDAYKITESCRRHSDFSEREGTIENDSLHLWFNQPCIYKTSNLDDFFCKIEMPEKLGELTFWDFDYNIYMLYLMYNCDFRIENIRQKSFGFASSSVPLARPEYIRDGMYMATPLIWREVKKLGGGGKIFMFVNIDRANNKQYIPKTKCAIIYHFVFHCQRAIRCFVACFVPVKKWRKKIRGQK